VPWLRLLVLTFAVVCCTTAAWAQGLPTPPPPESLLATAAPGPLAPQDQPTLCDGCPPRRLGKAVFQVTMINVFYGVANLVRGQVTARVTPETWWTNMERGWEWDLDDFTVNQFGHPYQGNNYFNAGRANGLTFWESAAVTAFGSGTWEYFGETNQASLNDFINTTLGGIALGEMFHRTAWLVRDTHKTGKSRLWNEIGALALDPVTGYNRFQSGDASRVTEKPAELTPSHLGAVTSAGVGWRQSTKTDESGTVEETSINPIVELDLLYGNLEADRSRTPYDAFGVRMTFGGGGPISEVTVRGRLLGQPLHNGVQLAVNQDYQYNKNDAYQFGAQSFDVSAGINHDLSSRVSMMATGWGGLTVLGAVDSIPPEGSVVPEAEDAGQGVSTGPRNYDYGPGTNFGGIIELRREQRGVARLSYDAHQLHVLDGARANHFLQRLRADVTLPLPGRFGMIVTGEFFDRHTYFQMADVAPAHFHFPQFRLSLTWNGS